MSLNRPAEAVEVFQRAYDLMGRLAANDPKDAMSRRLAANAALQMAQTLRDSNPERAVAVFGQCLSMLREVEKSKGTRVDEARCLAASTYPLRRLHRLSEAGQRLDTAMARLREAKAYPAERIVIDEQEALVLRAKADYEGEIGQWAASAATYRELLAKVLASKPSPQTNLGHANDLSAIYDGLARACRRIGESVEADGIEAQRLELWRNWDRKLPNNPFVLRRLAVVTRR